MFTESVFLERIACHYTARIPNSDDTPSNLLYTNNIGNFLHFLYQHAERLFIETAAPVVGCYMLHAHNQRSVRQHDMQPRADQVLFKTFDGV